MLNFREGENGWGARIDLWPLIISLGGLATDDLWGSSPLTLYEPDLDFWAPGHGSDYCPFPGSRE